MALINRRIETRAEVEALAGEQEGENLDYKGTADTSEWWELAKDIAAFANHLGGVVLLGAYERPDGLPNLRGLPAAEVKALANAYDKAARDRCRPSPLVTCKAIPWEDDREILAVNVQAYLGLVGAQFYVTRANKDASQPTITSAANAWQFPMRVGKDNPPLPLEQAIMHMSTHARRTAILLAGIENRNNMRLQFCHPETRSMVPWGCSLREHAVEQNVAVIQPHSRSSLVAVPLDDIEAVWRDADGVWCIRITGYLEDWTDSVGNRITSHFPWPR